MNTLHANKTALIVAGGTGGHIFPALATAQGLQQAGWRVQWLGGVGGRTASGEFSPSMESRIAHEHQIQFHAMAFSGVRGKGWRRLAALPFALTQAVWQSLRVIWKTKPHVVLCFGGYVSAPAGLAAYLSLKPLLLHEQNAIAGMAIKKLERFSTAIYTAFPDVLVRDTEMTGRVNKAHWIGNPLRAGFLTQGAAFERYNKRSGKLQLLVLGGSLGAQALNEIVPQALAALPEEERPEVLHQSGEKNMAQLQAAYAQAGIVATLVPFIDDVASAMAKADLLIARAGASTVCEVAAVGVGSIFIPYPHAVDDHQTANAQHLSAIGGAWQFAQADFTVARFLEWWDAFGIRGLIAQKGVAAQKWGKRDAVAQLVAACEACLKKDRSNQTPEQGAAA